MEECGSELSGHKPENQDFQEINGSINCLSLKDLAKTSAPKDRAEGFCDNSR